MVTGKRVDTRLYPRSVTSRGAAGTWNPGQMCCEPSYELLCLPTTHHERATDPYGLANPKWPLPAIPTLNKGVGQAGHHAVGSVLPSIGRVHLIHRDQERPAGFLSNLDLSCTLQNSYTD